MRILVIQLARLGDVIQTLPTLAGLKAKHPGCTIDLVVRETFADAAQLSPHVDRLIALPSKAILEPMLGADADKQPSKVLALAHLITWVADQFLEYTHKLGPYDLTLNLTFSESSSFLCQMIPSNERRGLKRASDGAYAVTDGWSAYVYSQVLRKNFNIIHLNDLFARIAGVAATDFEVVTKGFDSSYDLGPLVIGMQMGASQSNKTLNPKAWGLVAQGLLEALPEAHLVLFGSRDDKKRAQTVMGALSKKNKQRCTSLVGKLRFHENVPWVKRCHYMITPDTAMVHLAPLCGIKTINVSLGDVRPQDTGPYGEGHVVLRPRDLTLEEGMPGLIEALINVVMEEEISAEVPAFRTRLVNCTDGTKRNELTPDNHKSREIENLFEKAYYLLAEFRNSGRHEDLTIPEIGDPTQAERLKDLSLTLDALQTMRRLGEFGMRYCFEMLQNSENREALNELGAKISEIERLYRDLSNSVPFIRPLLDQWEIQKENVIGDGIDELASLTEATFRELVQNIDMVRQLIQIAVDAASAKLNIEKTAVADGPAPETLPEKESST